VTGVAKYFDQTVVDAFVREEAEHLFSGVGYRISCIS
jgi:hypothetical protein